MTLVAMIESCRYLADLRSVPRPVAAGGTYVGRPVGNWLCCETAQERLHEAGEDTGPRRQADPADAERAGAARRPEYGARDARGAAHRGRCAQGRRPGSAPLRGEAGRPGAATAAGDKPRRDGAGLGGDAQAAAGRDADRGRQYPAIRRTADAQAMERDHRRAYYRTTGAGRWAPWGVMCPAGAIRCPLPC